MTRVLLPDTMIFSALLRRNPTVIHKLTYDLGVGAVILVSPVVYYELKRGLLKRQATRLLEYLDSLLANLVWAELTRADWELAAELWTSTQHAGRRREDADLLIAAQANRRRATVVTENTRHFRDIAARSESRLT